MAFKSLDDLRSLVPGLNSELGLALDTDNSWGTTGERNAYIQRAFAKLWPSMGRLRRENLTTLTNTQDYTLTTIEDVERIEVLDTNTPTLVGSRIRGWQAFTDESADPVVVRLLIPAMIVGQTLRAIGYGRYIIPATGAATCDLPANLEHVVITGARVEAYRAQVNRFANTERFQNENRANALTAADVLELLRDTRREFTQALRDNSRSLVGAHRAQLQTG